MAGDRVSLDVSSSKLLEALTASNVPLLMSGRVAERFRNCSQNSDSVEVEIILKPDLMCAAKLMRAFDSILKDFVAGGSNIQDVNKMATPGFRIRPFLTSTDHLLTVAESVTAFEAMQARSTLAAIFESNLMVLAIEDIILLKQQYAEYWREKYLKHGVDLQRLQDKLAARNAVEKY